MAEAEKVTDCTEPADTSSSPSLLDLTDDKDGGVMKEIKRAGQAELGHPQTGDKVFVHYVGTLLDGTKFDSSRDRDENFEFTLGKGQVIKAWDLGVASMHKGELAVLTCQEKYAYGEAGSPPKIPPNATLVFEIELFDWKGEDLSTEKDESICRTTLKEGEGYKTPNDGATCEVHITGKHNGRVFEDRDAKITLGEAGECDIIEGIEIALKKFKQNEKSKLFIKSCHAYGSEGCAEKEIPPNADLEYEVTLKNFEKAKEDWEMDPPEKLVQSELKKEKGTGFFKQGKFDVAIKNYEKIIGLLENESSLEGEEAKKRETLLLAAHLNIAMCQLKLKNDHEAVESCDKALELDPQNEKGLFRKGTALMNIQSFVQAVEIFKKVLKIDPNNKAAKNQLAISNAKIKEQHDKDKRIYGGMFKKFADIDAKKESSTQKPDEQRMDSPEGTVDPEQGTVDPEQGTVDPEQGTTTEAPEEKLSADPEPMEAQS